ncbi:MAG: Hpt domain-containing protein [Rhodanobacteraceae bacterium]|nr:Hpt domain-containing protein [Rhodanobacteraceae bacterium]MBK7044285.1 Hpt domain-containing protein [Rhodanobacteraceae bacterium]MBP9154874.1 Hpt domain-containing protein [Xanthomonadales bacterium]HQW81323.1 Hpt domain-containing protein [Pseudomonadota bacterium]
MSDPVTALHARYLASFPNKRDELQAALSAWRQAPAAIDRIVALHLLVHNLAGSAGAYGFDTLADVARSADRLLKTHARDGDALVSTQIAPIDAAVVAVCSKLASS